MGRIVSVEQSPDVVTVDIESVGRRRFHAMWLRDNSLDATTRSSTNGQRLVTINDIDPTTSMTSCERSNDGSSITVTFAPCGTSATFTADWLERHAYDVERPAQRGWLPPTIETWTSSITAARLPRASWTTLSDEDAILHTWLDGVRRMGVGIVTDLPTTPGFLCTFARRFGYVRETNYGEYFEVRSEVTPSNLAYTNLGLQAHTDNPYRDPVPTMQILACLENSVDGGESTVVDAFAVAQALRDSSPENFELLTSHPVRFAYEGTSDVSLHAKRPIIELGPDGELLAVRFNNRSAAPFRDVPFDVMPAFYGAYRAFAELVDDPRFAVEFKLAPGEAFIVDNVRVLHARRAFSGSGRRWLQGCYVDRDGLESTLRVLEGR